MEPKRNAKSVAVMYLHITQANSQGWNGGYTQAEIDVIAEYNRLDVRLYAAAVREFDLRVETMGPGFKSELRMFTNVNDRFRRVAELMDRKAGLEQAAIVNAK